MRALPAASRGCAVSFYADKWVKARRDRDGVRVPARQTRVLRSGVVREIQRDGVFVVMTPNGFASVSPLAIVKITVPKEA